MLSKEKSWNGLDIDTLYGKLQYSPIAPFIQLPVCGELK